MNIYLQLKSEGKSVKEICEITGKTDSYVYTMLDPEGPAKSKRRVNDFRQNRMLVFKKMLGLKCSICGYCRCVQALDFHHKNKDLKKFEISRAVYQKIKVTDEELLEEVNKCVLVCSNCHREIHSDKNCGAWESDPLSRSL